MIIFIIISVLYAVLLIFYARLLRKYHTQFKSITEYEPGAKTHQKVSVIIPARNEEQNIGQCIDAIKQQLQLETEPDIIVIDDHSEDNTAAIAYAHHAAVIIDLKDEKPLTRNAYKKMAIAAGIKYAKTDLILTTDADCIVPPNWVNLMTGLMAESKAVMVAGPVRMVPDKTFFSKFQSLDYAILQGITAASVHSGYHDMSSGANLCYRKSVFEEVGGFEGIDDIASGDDMLLMQKFSAKYPGLIHYAFSRKAIVDTRTEDTVVKFLRQRIRWASKARRYKDKKIIYILLLVYLVNVCMLALMVMAFFSPVYFSICLAALTLKIAVEWNFVSGILNFFSLSHLMQLFPVVQPLHVIYTVLSGTFGQLGKVEWKGRHVK